MPAKQAIKATNSGQKVGSNWRGFYLLLTFWEEISRVWRWHMIQFYELQINQCVQFPRQYKLLVCKMCSASSPRARWKCYLSLGFVYNMYIICINKYTLNHHSTTLPRQGRLSQGSSLSTFWARVLVNKETMRIAVPCLAMTTFRGWNMASLQATWSSRRDRWTCCSRTRPWHSLIFFPTTCTLCNQTALAVLPTRPTFCSCRDTQSNLGLGHPQQLSGKGSTFSHCGFFMSLWLCYHIIYSARTFSCAQSFLITTAF